MHKFTCLFNTQTCLHRHVDAQTLRWRSAQWSQSYLCFYVLCFLTVLVFFTPPVAMCHHLPARRLGAGLICRQVLRKIQSPKVCPCGVWTVEAEIWCSHMMFDIFIHFLGGRLRDALLCSDKDKHCVQNYLPGANALFFYTLMLNKVLSYHVMHNWG